jgi:hypothetical protein
LKPVGDSPGFQAGAIVEAIWFDENSPQMRVADKGG